MSVNKVIIIGNCGSDPRTKHLEGDRKVASFSVAVSEKYKNKAGEVVEQTEWLNCVAWNKLAEIIEKFVTKGMLVYIEGKIKTRNYEKDGQKHYVTEIFADTLQMLSKSDAKPEAPGAANEPANKPESTALTDVTELDDLPF